MVGERIDEREIIIKTIYELNDEGKQYWSKLISMSNQLFSNDEIVKTKLQRAVNELILYCYSGEVNKFNEPNFPSILTIEEFVANKGARGFDKVKNLDGWGWRKIQGREILNKFDGIRYIIYDEIGKLNVRYRDTNLTMIR